MTKYSKKRRNTVTKSGKLRPSGMQWHNTAYLIADCPNLPLSPPCSPPLSAGWDPGGFVELIGDEPAAKLPAPGTSLQAPAPEMGSLIVKSPASAAGPATQRIPGIVEKI